MADEQCCGTCKWKGKNGFFTMSVCLWPAPQWLTGYGGPPSVREDGGDECLCYEPANTKNKETDR